MMTPLTGVNWAKARHLVLWLAVGALVLNAGRLLYMRVSPLHAQSTSRSAFTILRTESVFDRAGKLLGTNHYVEAVRADGSRTWRASSDKAQSRRIWFANGDYVRTNEITGRMSTLPKRDPANSIRSCPDKRLLDSGWVNGGEEMVGGYRTVRMTHSGTFDMTIWFGLDLSCAVLRQHYEDDNGTTDQNLEAVILGEPDAALFQISASLKESSPSKLGCPADGLPCSVVSADEHADKKYHDLRLKAGIE